MIIFNKLDNNFVVSADSQTFLGFEMTANFRDTSPLTTIFVQPVLYALFVWVTKQKQNKRHLSENEKEIILVVKIA